ncbi:hypothetical protein CSC70_02600 [Pseudoxanthomonas kalamensis DSM 18571]|uniref:hypothetical protein n=1 Tax=Pseudoxanthomonas kalamensis TaxID=289483 RepID=UPI001391969A|nr:hypothetical protein [Pseudoxanthomonas kalamensis]KAF1712429.1 hypothetical protein CSC70_02600 [Pseudoxanthomonas kalamensis DSM 18571]
MTRNSPLWLPIGFLVALIGVGFKYWQLQGEASALPQALYGPGLAAVAVVAMLLRAFGTGRFVKVWLTVAASVPAAYLIGLLAGASSGSPMLQPWLQQLAIAIGLGLAAALVGTAIGSLLLLRSSRRPE